MHLLTNDMLLKTSNYQSLQCTDCYKNSNSMRDKINSLFSLSEQIVYNTTLCFTLSVVAKWTATSAEGQTNIFNIPTESQVVLFL